MTRIVRSKLLTRRHILRGVGGSVFLPGSMAGAASVKVKSPENLHRLHAPAVHRHFPSPKPIIMLDPGHGGKDPGAIGVSGTYEKYIAEAAARQLRLLLLHSGRYQVVLSRYEDRFIPLEGRVELAHKHKVQLFISMHADALVQPEVRGASVYTLSNSASDKQTELLAQKENSADRFSMQRASSFSQDVEQILSGLVHEETRRGSAHMASSVIRSFHNRVRLLSHPSRHASFAVLKSADIPSVLVEMGFMSNHLDEQFLRKGSYRMRVARALHSAIDYYFSYRGV